LKAILFSNSCDFNNAACYSIEVLGLCWAALLPSRDRENGKRKKEEGIYLTGENISS
jgi:hypothetical protein